MYAAAQNITALPAQQPHQPRIDTADDAGATMNLFTPNYGAASSHIAELMKERDDFIDASRHQAARIQELEQEKVSLQELNATLEEQLQVQALIAESRARQIEEQQEIKEQTDAKVDKLRSAVRLLWGVLEEQSMRINEQRDAVKAGKDLLESLSDLLAVSDKDKAADASEWAKYARDT